MKFAVSPGPASAQVSSSSPLEHTVANSGQKAIKRQKNAFSNVFINRMVLYPAFYLYARFILHSIIYEL